MIDQETQRIIKDLIVNGYEVDLNDLEELQLVIKLNNIKTVEDYDEVIWYLNWYTEKTEKQGVNWRREFTIDLYYRYLNLFKDIEGMDPRPKQDMFHLCEIMEKIKLQSQQELNNFLRERVSEEYKKKEENLNW